MLATNDLTSGAKRWAMVLVSLVMVVSFPTLFGACVSIGREVSRRPPDGGSCVPSGPNSGPGCTGRRWIGYFANGNCTLPAGVGSEWSVSPLFGKDTASKVLNGYCLFEVETPTEDDSKEFRSAGLAEDCVSVGTMADPPEVTAVRKELRTSFVRFATGVADPSDLPALPSEQTTTVAVVDTKVPSHSNPTHHHGAIVSGVINDVGCGDGGPCLVDVEPELGLPHTDNDNTDYDNGGSFGTPGQLAKAIVLAVEKWKIANYESNEPPSHPRLVINLSVGWQPGNDCSLNVEDLSCSARAVYDALRYAACEGVLVVAAAGNSPGGASRFEPTWSATGKPRFAEHQNPSAKIEGATCPGAWTVIPTPSKQECEAILSPGDPVHKQTSFPASDPTPRSLPLLVAVAGVDYSDAPLANARKGARSSHAALGILATTPLDAPGGELSPPISGSSIGAATWSAIAASAWSFKPTLTRGQIIQEVYESGIPTGLDAELSVANGPVVTRRANLCAAIHAVCSNCPLSCEPSEPFGAAVPPIDALTDNLSTIFAGGVSMNATISEVSAPSSLLQATEALPWVRPQPERPPCGVCASYANQVYISVNPEYTYQINAMTVTDMASNTYRVTFGTPLVANDRVVVSVSGLSMSVRSLSFEVQSPDLKGSVTQQPFLQ